MPPRHFKNAQSGHTVDETTSTAATMISSALPPSSLVLRIFPLVAHELASICQAEECQLPSEGQKH